jgi:hypothetical protein
VTIAQEAPVLCGDATHVGLCVPNTSSDEVMQRVGTRE